MTKKNSAAVRLRPNRLACMPELPLHIGQGGPAMPNRWTILFVLFLARLAMAVQFQSVAVLSPLMSEHLALSLADIGLLIGLYLAPGVVVAMPGGALAGWIGEKRIVVVSLGLMLAGGLLVGWGGSWGALVAGRVIAGIGGVIINVVLTKMVVDWFVGREISTALSIFIISWPLGIAMALLVLPPLAAPGDLGLAWAVVLGLLAVSLGLFGAVYRAPAAPPAARAGPYATGFPVGALLLAGAIWALYNGALAMIFSFGPALLADRGVTLIAASSMTSLFMVLLSVALPLGGLLADRTGRPDTIIAVSLASYVVLIPLVLHAPASTLLPILIVAGGLFGLGGGAIAALPSRVLEPASRSFGMGLFFTIYYGWMMAAPVLAGLLADRSGDIGAVALFGAAMAAVSVVALALFKLSSARWESPRSR
jgi:MFS family permease